MQAWVGCGIVWLPGLLLSISLLASAMASYGVHPWWARFEWGYDLILLSRRLQWPLLATALLGSGGLAYLVVAGRRSIWWLLGVAPVAAMIISLTVTAPANRLQVADNPASVGADAAEPFAAAGDWVVGVTVEDQPWALPFSQLYRTPVVILRGRTQRVMVIWSAHANRATAMTIDRDISARELDIVGAPANALLVYNARYGQFINGVTGLRPNGQPPTGRLAAISTSKMLLERWAALHPDTRVMALTSDTDDRSAASLAPARPVLPMHPMPPVPIGFDPALHASAQGSAASAGAPDLWVTVIFTDPPVALTPADLSDRPINLQAGETPVVALVDRRTGRVRAFDRRVDGKPRRFALVNDPSAAMIDTDTGTRWTASGESIGLREPKRLAPIEIDQDLYWDVMRTWFPRLTLHQVTAEDFAQPPPPPADPPRRTRRSR